ncbi:unnamed protein product [Echinostoma caproni]|uniref:BPTI/Kunitz inhibitor domain-containing protein n=1 Tax=Echinostoma caproni TaxID=27848 RepID=A0A183AY89_9TREM|nr:unnamed protein product [Echinostoma caproni]
MSTDSTYPKRYYFNQSTQMCEPFHFTGMLAHGNNFPTMATCNATCLFVPDIEAITMPAHSNEPIAQSDLADPTRSEVKRPGPNNWGARPQTTEANNSSKYPVVGSPSVENQTAFQSPCLTPLSSYGASELAKQTICDSEDIIRELGYRFRAIEHTDGTTNNGQLEGICELTLVPICLSEPKMVFGGLVDSRMRTIGRVFQTQAECEKTCLNNRRIRRSARDRDDSDNEQNTSTSEDTQQLEVLVESILEKSGYESGK